MILSRSQQFPNSSTWNQVELGKWATGQIMHCDFTRPHWVFLNSVVKNSESQDQEDEMMIFIDSIKWCQLVKGMSVNDVALWLSNHYQAQDVTCKTVRGKTEMSLFRRKFHTGCTRQLPVQPVIKLSSQWGHFHFRWRDMVWHEMFFSILNELLVPKGQVSSQSSVLSSIKWNQELIIQPQKNESKNNFLLTGLI